MGMITLKEYAERNGRSPASARHMAERGRFQTAARMGRDWFVDEDEPYPDARVKSGKYIGWREKYSGIKMESPSNAEAGTAVTQHEKRD